MLCKRFCLLLLLGVVGCSGIFQGIEANLGRYPYFATLNVEVLGGFFLCGATLIHDDMLLSAAQCSIDAISYIATINSTTFETKEDTEYHLAVDFVLVHPNFTAVRQSNDIMVIRLARAVVPSVPFVAYNRDPAVPADNVGVTVIGLGEITETGGDPEFLQEASVSTVSHAECDDMNSYFGAIVDREMICAGIDIGGSDACTGDGGGPLLVKGSDPSSDLQVGIVSFGFGCGRRDFPGVYTRVSQYADWIDEQICLYSGNPPPGCTGRTNVPTTAPSAAPTRGGGGGFNICFSGETNVVTRQHGVIPMHQLQVGDSVLVSPDGTTYERVYGFGHYHKTTESRYLQVHVGGGRPALEISPNHMVFLEGNRVVPASALMIGDGLVSIGDGMAVVVDIREVTRAGAYAPFTPSGTVMINGLLVSNYVVFDGGDSGYFSFRNWQTPFTHHFLAHLFETPHRLLGFVLRGESYTHEGISHWVYTPMLFLEWFNRQHPAVMMAVLLPPFCLFCIVWLLEQFVMRALNNPLALLTVVLSTALIIKLMMKRQQASIRVTLDKKKV